MGLTGTSFCLYLSFLKHDDKNSTKFDYIGNSVDGVLGI